MGKDTNTTAQRRTADRMTSWFIYGAIFGAAITIILYNIILNHNYQKNALDIPRGNPQDQTIHLLNQVFIGIDNKKYNVLANDDGIFFFHLYKCPHCKKALPILRSRLGQKRVTIIVSAQSESKDEAFNEVRRLSDNLPGSWKILFDPEGKISSLWGVVGYPTLAFIKGGEAVLIRTGISNKAQYENFIDMLIDASDDQL